MPKGIYPHTKITKTLEQVLIVAVREALNRPRCSAPDCQEFCQNNFCGYCVKHYARVRRKRPLEYQLKGRSSHSRGYIIEHIQGHPLAGAFGRVFQHRRVFYDSYGEGPFQCHWCGADVTWATLHIDHLDNDRKHNEPDNLVTACKLCNQQRGLMLAFLARVKRHNLILYNSLLMLGQPSQPSQPSGSKGYV